MASTLTGITAQTLLYRYFPAVYLALAAFLGCVAGWLAVLVFGLHLVTPLAKKPIGAPSKSATVRVRPLSDYQVILDRNIFDPEGAASVKLSDSGRAAGSVTTAPAAAASEGKQKAAVAIPKKLTLIGTLAAGSNSLAVLQNGKEVHVYHLGDEIATGVTVAEILRDTVVLVSRDGSRQTLTIANNILNKRASLGVKPAPLRRGVVPAAGSPIKEVGKNRYIIPNAVAEHARANVGELMREARMEPHLVNGRTDGFVVRMIRPHSFLAQLGLRLGDVVTAINGVQLSSPEKALQVFQQLREANDIRVDLLRQGQPLTLEFQTD